MAHASGFTGLVRGRAGRWVARALGGRSSVRRTSAGRATVAAKGATVEPLEDRRLMAAQFPAGFQYQVHASIKSPAAAMDFAPDGRIFYTEKAGNLWLVNKNGQTNPSPVLTVAVDTYAERGLDGVVLDPNFASNNFLYVYYTKADPAKPNQPPNNAKNRLSRYTFDPSTNKVVPGSERILIDDIPNQTGYHNGGSMHFGADGMMYVGVGEAGLGTQAADVSKLTGKILRINPSAYPNIIPADNPFVNTPGARGEVWATGFRNPFTSAIRPGTNELFVNDVGSTDWEEINRIQKGGFYGWNKGEGPTADPNDVDPIYSYNHATDSNNGFNAAITGGVFYTGNNFPASYQGKYIFGDFVNRRIRVLDTATNKATPFASDVPGPMDMDIGPDGALYVLSSYGQQIYKVSYVGAGQNRTPVANATVDKDTGATPLVVNFDGSTSTDPDNDALTYAWDFGDGSTGTGAKVAHTYTTKGSFNAKLTVSDGKGGTATSQTIVIHAGSRPPVIAITTPGANSTYTGAQTIQFSGTANDPEQGTLPASAYKWQVVFHHGNHTHPFLDDVNGVTGGSFQIPTDAEPDPDQWYRIHLTVTDADGTFATKELDVRPQTSQFTFRTNIPGLSVNLDGAAQTGPKTVTAVVGTTRSLGAPATQTLNGKSYRFTGWSDNGAATHNISIAATPTTYTANYAQVGTAPTGLLGTYYDNPDFSGTSVQRLDADVNFDWGANGPADGIAGDTFSARWTGKVTPPTTGEWTFYAEANDGVRVTVGGNPLIADFLPTGLKERTSAAVPLTGGRPYDIRIDFFDNTNSASIKLYWSGPGVAKQLVPTNVLTPPPGVGGGPAAQTVRRPVVPWMSAVASTQSTLSIVANDDEDAPGVL